MWTLDIWGQIRREIEVQQAAAEVDRRQSGERDFVGSVGAGGRVRHAALRGLAGGPADQNGRGLQAFAHDHPEPIQRRHGRQVRRHHRAGASAERPGDAHRRRRDPRAERACDRSADGPPAGRVVDPAWGPVDPRPVDSRAVCRRPCSSAGPTSRRRRRRCDRRTHRSASISPAIFPRSRCPGCSATPATHSPPQLGPTNPVWSFGASLAQPVFNGGLTGAQVEAARELYKSEVGIYRQTVLTAIQQVEDNLSGIRILSREAKAWAENVRISRQATQIALNEYQAGTQAYTTVVTAEAAAAYGGRVAVVDTGADSDSMRSVSSSRWAAAGASRSCPTRWRMRWRRRRRRRSDQLDHNDRA